MARSEERSPFARAVASSDRYISELEAERERLREQVEERERQIDEISEATGFDWEQAGFEDLPHVVGDLAALLATYEEAGLELIEAAENVADRWESNRDNRLFRYFAPKALRDKIEKFRSALSPSPTGGTTPGSTASLSPPAFTR